jgi:hypothetical protein
MLGRVSVAGTQCPYDLVTAAGCLLSGHVQGILPPTVARQADKGAQ